MTEEIQEGTSRGLFQHAIPQLIEPKLTESLLTSTRLIQISQLEQDYAKEASDQMKFRHAQKTVAHQHARHVESGVDTMSDNFIVS
jgi:hypothetical protein